MTLSQAVEVFVRGFSFMKSQAHPYLAEQHGDLWVMKDGPGRRHPRKSEIIVVGDAKVALETSRRLAVGWHFLCHVHGPGEDPSAVKASYKSLGYRYLGSEGLFAHDMAEIPVLESEPPVRLVDSAAELAAVNQLARHKRKLLEPTKLFGVWDEKRDYGWVRSVPVSEFAWVADLFVYKEVRGRGYGRALMSALLQHQRDTAVRSSVLTASSDGARLYPHLGYRQMGALQIFCPMERA